MKKYPFTISDISDLLDLKLSYNFDKFEAKMNKKIDDSETGIIAEMDKRFAEVDSRFDGIDKRFDDNDEAHQILLGAIEDTGNRKIKEHVAKMHSFATA